MKNGDNVGGSDAAATDAADAAASLANKNTRSDGDGAHGHVTSRSTSKDSPPTPSMGNSKDPLLSAAKSPRKRRKVNHACVYCRRSHMTCDLERPCTRCIKRNIGHLCHDEPRDMDNHKGRAQSGIGTQGESEPQDMTQGMTDQTTAAPPSIGPPSFAGSGAAQSGSQGYGADAPGQANPLQLVLPGPNSGLQGGSSQNNVSQFAGFSDAWLTTQNQLHDMHSYNPQYMLAPEVTHEFNLLNDFLNTSLIDEGGSLSKDQGQISKNGQPGVADKMGVDNRTSTLVPVENITEISISTGMQEAGSTPLRPATAVPQDKAREFLLQAADPSGNDTPEERMHRVLTAKYEAGLLKPFNYVNGYKRLHDYMSTHVEPAAKGKIIRQLERFRPKFREKVHLLSDIQLVMVEMWFERTLLEYDRIFAAMAVPACCWRRTGEIFRGNKEMAELIHVPVERLRDGKLSLHEILTEDSLVRYWEEFGTIAFDSAHDTILTACALKSPDDESKDPIVNCCFSFMIRRDESKIPSLIVGNFLPHDP